MLSRFHPILERYGQTNGQNSYISVTHQYADAIKTVVL